MMRRIGRPTEGRSRRVRVYRLWICDDWVPHEGQADVEEVVRRVRMISSDTSTSSTSISGKSGMIIIGCVLVPRKTNENENLFNPLLYHNWHQQTCVRSLHFTRREDLSQDLHLARNARYNTDK